MSARIHKSASPVLRCSRLVVLRWRRTGKGRRATTDGRFLAYQVRAKRWTLFDRDFHADTATWSQICETARQRLEREAQHNVPDQPHGK